MTADNPIFQIVSQQFVTEVVWKNTRIRYANPTGLVILKLYALPSLYRQRKFNRTDQYQIDIAAIMRTFPLDFDLIFQVLSRELIPSDVQKLWQIVQELSQDRTSRFQ